RTDNEASKHIHVVAMEIVNGTQSGITADATSVTRSVLGGSTQELQIVFQNILNSQENPAESAAAHQRRQSLTMGRDGGSHALHNVVEIVQAVVDDGLAETLEAADIESDVVINHEDAARSMGASITNVIQDSFEGVGMKVAAPHFDNRAKAAIVS